MSAGKKKEEESRQTAERGITQAGQQVTQAAQLTPYEEASRKRAYELQKMYEDISLGRLGLGEMPSGYQTPEQQYMAQASPLGRQLYDVTAQELQDPYKYYEDTLQQELGLAQDAINRYYQSRGLIRSGLPIKAMVRAGAELAIRKAGERLSYRQNVLGRAAGMEDVIQGRGTENLARLSEAGGRGLQIGQVAAGRQVGGAQAAAGYAAYPFQAQLGSYYGGVAAQQALPGQLIGAGGTILGARLGAPRYTFNTASTPGG